MRGLPMRFFNRLLVSFLLFVALLPGAGVLAQTTAAGPHSEEEDLRQTVRELALRVTALEEELHRQRTGTAMESASLKPAALAVPRVDVRSSVESLSTSGAAETPPAASVATMSETGQTA